MTKRIGFTVVLGMIVVLTTTAFMASKKSQSPLLAPAKMQGKIIKRDFLSKKGVKVRDTYDLFFETTDTAYFIKMSESKITQSQAVKYLNKPITIKGKFKDGLWDTSDPKVQSRMGTYLIIQKILD